MLNDNKGQISMEYLLIFTISLIILLVFTLPLVEYTIQSGLDVSDSLKVKSDLQKITSSVKQVYLEGQGSKQTVIIDSSRNINVKINKNRIYTDIKLNDGKNKRISIDCASNLEYESLTLKKGVNTFVVEWPVGGNMVIYRQY